MSIFSQSRTLALLDYNGHNGLTYTTPNPILSIKDPCTEPLKKPFKATFQIYPILNIKDPTLKPLLRWPPWFESSRCLPRKRGRHVRVYCSPGWLIRLIVIVDL